MTQTPIDLGLNFDNSYANELDGFYVACLGDVAPAPLLVKLNEPLAKQLGLTNFDSDQLALALSGGNAPLGTSPLAQVYAGHQFGGFNPQLGDGRALLLGEVLDKQGQRFDLQLKGSGPTRFSRGGDGKATIGAVLREYIVSEAMNALDIPTTRALAAVTTGETILRNNQQLPGAVLARIASSHLRVGTFQYFAVQGEQDKVKLLADHAIGRHYPEVLQSEQPYLAFLCAVRDRQAKLIANWLLVGFVHGVMNTDNMTISGETIDYGPCAFIDDYDANAVFSSIDRDGRYKYSNQAAIAQWNLARLAETLLPLINTDDELAIAEGTQAVSDFWTPFKYHWLKGMRAKLGLTTEEDTDFELGEQLLESMQGQKVDFTLLFRQLASDLETGRNDSEQLFSDSTNFNQWRQLWLTRLAKESISTLDSVKMMNQVNPLYIARNHLVEQAIEAAEQHGDYQPFEQLVRVLANPYTAQSGAEDYAKPAPASFGPFVSYCGT
ncbi:protein adenylyltransferase SelO [Shewanella psychrotolerans]|uniref:protein adenylyltransferase SelO n=1 Tax=Shewanella psychrotolerans TaxID=2864206 RepID=UPI001C65BDC1|nr:YdiU family protein [Shewanella psychrotolerans]QYK02051.1 YdiU family protein [Shewanella psychrotolerans]